MEQNSISIGTESLTNSINNQEGGNMVNNFLNLFNLGNSDIVEKLTLIAGFENKHDVVIFLIEKYEQFDFSVIDDNKNTILHHIAKSPQSYNKDFLQNLLKNIDKSVINMQNEDGNTAAIIAVKNDKSDFVKLLKDNGADLNIKNNDGNTIKSISDGESITMTDDNMLNTEQMKDMLNNKNNNGSEKIKIMNNDNNNIVDKPDNIQGQSIEGGSSIENTNDFIDDLFKKYNSKDNNDTETSINNLVDSYLSENQKGGSLTRVKGTRKLPLYDGTFSESKDMINKKLDNIISQQAHDIRKLAIKNIRKHTGVSKSLASDYANFIEGNVAEKKADLDKSIALDKVAKNRDKVMEYREAYNLHSETVDKIKKILADNLTDKDFAKHLGKKPDEQKILDIARSYKSALWEMTKKKFPSPPNSNLKQSQEMVKLADKKTLKEINLDEAIKIRKQHQEEYKKKKELRKEKFLEKKNKQKKSDSDSKKSDKKETKTEKKETKKKETKNKKKETKKKESSYLADDELSLTSDYSIDELTNISETSFTDASI